MTTTAEELAKQAEEILEWLNDNFPDALEVLARTKVDNREVKRAEVTAIDVAGIDLLVLFDDGQYQCHVPFVEPLADTQHLFEALTVLLQQAKEALGDQTRTSVDHAATESEINRQLRFVTSEVSATRLVHPGLREITLQGEGLRTLRSVGPDAFLLVMVPQAHQSSLTVNETFTIDTLKSMEADQQPHMAYYTIRQARPEVGEIDLWIVLHGDDGPLSAWAARTTPGDPVALWGPRSGWQPPEDTDHYLLVADETGLPAVAAIIEVVVADRAPGASVPTVTVLAEVADEAHQQPLPVHPGVEVRWLHRNGAENGVLLAKEALKQFPQLAPRTYVWGASESHCQMTMRAALKEQGFDRRWRYLIGYWRRSTD